MARTQVRFAGPDVPPDPEASAYTVPVGKIAVIRAVTVVGLNTDNGYLAIGSGGSTRFVMLTSIEDSSETLWQYEVLGAGEEIFWFSGGNMLVSVNGDLYDA